MTRENVNNDVSIKDMTKYAELESQDIIDSDVVVIILLPAGRGALIELGIALALNKKKFLNSAKEEFNIQNTVAFYELSNVIKLIGTDNENIKEIIKL